MWCIELMFALIFAIINGKALKDFGMKQFELSSSPYIHIIFAIIFIIFYIKKC